MTPYKIETECATNESPLGIMDDVYMTTIHLDKDNKAYGYGESAEESVQDAVIQLAFTLTLDDKDSYHGFKVSLLPEHLQPLMIEQLKRRRKQLQSRTIKVTRLIAEWHSEQSSELEGQSTMNEPKFFAGKVSIMFTVNGKQEIASYGESDVRLLCGDDWDEWCILEQTSFDPERYATAEEHNEAWDAYVAAIKPALDYAHKKLKAEQ